MYERNASGSGGETDDGRGIPGLDPRLFDGLRTNRILAFFIDAAVIVALTLAGGLLLLFLGLFTFGLGWLLFPVLGPGVALAYVSITLGGPHSATPGMRAMGITMRMLDGRRPDMLIAAMHALLFWFSFSLLTPLVLLVSFFNAEKRLLHDIVLGVVVVNRGRETD
ncbi:MULTISPECIES: RDD family protein [unclassified Stappia]|uniref:RDD family protein n=1 Tax=unclassified Stappia TaxID=2629676 RepID=UPI0016436FA6|nr:MULTISPECIES: RDD family protein [unclassified Stappia]